MKIRLTFKDWLYEASWLCSDPFATLILNSACLVHKIILSVDFMKMLYVSIINDDSLENADTNLRNPRYSGRVFDLSLSIIAYAMQ